MRIPLPDGSFTDGKIDYTGVPKQLGIHKLDLTGQRILDIAANDGFWTFWAEQQGATDLLAIDVDSMANYDWGREGPPPSVLNVTNRPSQWSAAGGGFRALHTHLKSVSQRRTMSVYDLDPRDVGEFDVVFNFGLLYHLRHPLLSLDRTRSVCRGVMILETHLVNGFDDLPVSLFYRRDEFRGPTAWTGPTQSVVVNWLLSAGYKHIFSNRTDTSTPQARRIFVACVTDDWAQRFAKNRRLLAFDREYQDHTFGKTRKLLGAS